ncbi:type II toxin-antitoxin system RelE/ParE family toxin [Pseudoalteromonas rhizosphaerae]|uniref:type II toxin-antitoxin system RelE/ParE family toxin n=1 Tax=Pseudoalteromonas rhizosphaerae TaxID=2518973 RepID=UPI0015D23AD2|nr:type II toxin-antitoxin system RelE/ParE family toxin [Pseudoalteromonas rhizosphaerae]
MIKDRPIKLGSNLNIVEETAECLQSYYDGELILKVKGLWFAGKFRGNEPLFKLIVGTPGLWEVRFSAFSGGAIRMLYRTYNNKNILLVGFIKKSDNEGYKQNIQQAEDIFIKTYAA